MDDAGKVYDHIAKYMRSIANMSIKESLLTGELFYRMSTEGHKVNTKNRSSKIIADLLDAHAVYHFKAALYDMDKGLQDKVITDKDYAELKPIIKETEQMITELDARRD